MCFLLKIQTVFILLVLAGVCCSAAEYAPPPGCVKILEKYRSYKELTSAAEGMDIDTYTANLVSWQMPHGGWDKAKAQSYKNVWNGKSLLSGWTGLGGVALGTFDNNATIQEMRLLAERYGATKDEALRLLFKESFCKGVQFILASQYASGAWPQVYPKRGNYSDLATYNDNAMIRLMVMVADIVNRTPPFDTDIVPTQDAALLRSALERAVDFTCKAQIVDGGVLTVWCAQHDPVSYLPKNARAYELASKSGSESVAIVHFLMAWPNQSETVQNSVLGAIGWFKKTRLTDLAFDGTNGIFVERAGASLWYRFYDLEGDRGFFCGRDGVKKYDITEIEMERRTGYNWGGDFASSLITLEEPYRDSLGVFNAVTTPPHHSRSQPHFYQYTNRISVTVGGRGTCPVTLFDAHGAVISSFRLPVNNGVIEVPLSQGRRRSGVTFLSVTNPDGSVFTVQPLLHL